MRRGESRRSTHRKRGWICGEAVVRFLLFRNWVWRTLVLMVLSSNLSFAADALEWSEAREAGNRLYKLGQVEAAEKKYLEALKIAESFAENDGRLSSTLSGL